MHLVPILSDLRFRDVVDILFLSLVAYHLYVWFWGTKAFKALVGLLVLGIIFTVARFWGLFLTTWAFQILWQVLIVMLIVLFQSEIRQVLERVNPLKVLGLRALSKTEAWIGGFVEGVFTLARRKTGALVIIERSDLVEELVTEGIPLDSEPSPQVLLSVFHKESPLHDGAMLIRRGRITEVACYLPLSSAEGLPKEWGTRHRAALGLSERCDAWVVVVSEERGVASLARGREMVPVKDAEQLSRLVREATTSRYASRTTWWREGLAMLTYRWPIKLGALVLVSFLWLLLAGQQDFQVAMRVPLTLKNLPPKMEILEPAKPEVEVTVRGLRKDAATLTEKDLYAELDLSTARFGNRVFRITRDDIVLPNDRLYVVDIEPHQVTFKIRESQ